jgi:hypothetical protein
MKVVVVVAVVEIKLKMNEHFVIEETLEQLVYLLRCLVLMMKELKRKDLKNEFGFFLLNEPIIVSSSSSSSILFRICCLVFRIIGFIDLSFWILFDVEIGLRIL